MGTYSWPGVAAVVTALLFAAASTAAAQHGPPFDPPGPPPVRPPVTDRGGPLVGPRSASRTAVTPAVRAASAQLRSALRAGRLAPLSGPRIEGAVQDRLLALLTAATAADHVRPPAAAHAPLVAALSGSGNAAARPEARALVGVLRGLLDDPGRLPAAVTAYNDYVRASAPDFFAEPSEDFLALHASLAALVEAAAHGADPDAR